MNKAMFVAVVLIFFFMMACSSNPVDVVKNGRLGFDKSTTVGNALDNYPYFKSTNWKSFQDAQKRTIVEFTGVFDMAKLLENYRDSNNDTRENTAINNCLQDKNCKIYSQELIVNFQFLVMEDGTFKLGGARNLINGQAIIAAPAYPSDIKHFYQGIPMYTRIPLFILGGLPVTLQ